VRKSGWTVSDNILNSFSFEPLPGSRGKAYYFRLSVGEGKGVKPAALADWAERYPAGALVVDGVPYRGGLAFRIYNAVEREKALGSLLKRVTLNKPGPLNKTWLLRILALAHLLLAGVVVGLLTSFAVGARKKV
jgi:hypothetical protein